MINKNMSKTNIIILVVLVAAIGGFVYLSQDSKSINEGQVSNVENNNGIMMEDGVDSSSEGFGIKAGPYEVYSDEKLAFAETADVLLFFHAEWCPICRAIENEINKDPSIIPEGVHILKVDFDTAISLRQKYGVTVQHTFVQVDSSGNAILKFSNASKLSDVLSRIK